MQVIDPEIAAFLGNPTPAPSTPPSTPAPAPPAADPLACLEGITQDKPKGRRKQYPVFRDPDGTAQALANRSLELAEAAEQLKTNNKLLGEHCLPQWFEHNHGKADPDSALKVLGTHGAVLAVFTSRLKRTVDADIGLINNTIRSQYAYLYTGKVDALTVEEGKAIGFEAWNVDFTT
jgi:hypothetical protein